MHTSPVARQNISPFPNVVCHLLFGENDPSGGRHDSPGSSSLGMMVGVTMAWRSEGVSGPTWCVWDMISRLHAGPSPWQCTGLPAWWSQRATGKMKGAVGGKEPTSVSCTWKEGVVSGSIRDLGLQVARNADGESHIW